MIVELDNNIKSLRKERSMTQADLAKMAGVSRKTINTIENRIFVPSTVLALKLSKVLEVPVDDVFKLVQGE